MRLLDTSPHHLLVILGSSKSAFEDIGDYEGLLEPSNVENTTPVVRASEPLLVTALATLPFEPIWMHNRTGRKARRCRFSL